LINTGSGAGVVRKINDLIAGCDNTRSTFILEEAQNTWNPMRGSPAVLDILESYMAGIPRTILVGENWKDLDLFVPCIMNGRPKAEYAPGKFIFIPDNFFERCLEIRMPHCSQEELARLQPFDFVDALEEFGERYRSERLQWSNDIGSEVKKVRKQIDMDLREELGLLGRDKQLRQGIAEYWWYCGDDLYKMFLEEHKRYITFMADRKKRETQDELLDDLWTLCDRRKLTFFRSTETVSALKELSDTWKYYLDKPDGLNPKNLASLLARYDIKPDPDGKEIPEVIKFLHSRCLGGSSGARDCRIT
jgi:hypothetical protein